MKNVQPNSEQLVQSIRDKLNAITKDIAQQTGWQVKEANPRMDYCLGLGEGFWNRAKILPDVERTYVDGYNGQCNWNSGMVVVRSVGADPMAQYDLFSAIFGTDLKIWRGYAYSPGIGPLVAGWCEHTWCMDGDTLIETTGPFVAYFGAELTDEQAFHFAEGLDGYDPTQGHGGLGWTVDSEGHRAFVPANEVRGTIGLPKKPKAQ
jgi:hypothetical protein